MRALLTTTSVAVAAALALGVGPTSVTKDAAAWEPKKPVQFVVMAGKGGGADKAVRFMQNIIAKNKLSSKPFTPINKPGARAPRRWSISRTLRTRTTPSCSP